MCGKSRTASIPPGWGPRVDDSHFVVAVEATVGLYGDVRVTDADLAWLRLLTSLEGFSLGQSASAQVTSEGLRGLTEAKGLRRFAVVDAGHLGDADFAWLSDLPGLREIDLSGSGLSDRGLGALPLKDLQTLKVAATNVTDAGIVLLKQCSDLRHLTLNGTAVSDKAVMTLASSLRNLETLELEETQVTDEAVNHLVKMQRLECLSLSNTRITNEAVVQLNRLPRLREIHLGGTSISASGVRSLASIATLKSICLSEFGRPSRIDDAIVAELATFDGLEELYLDGTLITDKTLMLIQKRLPSLRVLSLGETRLSVEARNALRAARPRLQTGYWPAAAQPRKPQ